MLNSFLSDNNLSNNIIPDSKRYMYTWCQHASRR